MHAGFWWGNVRGKRVLGRPGQRWDNNVKMDPYYDKGVDWIDLACDRCSWQGLLSIVTNL